MTIRFQLRFMRDSYSILLLSCGDTHSAGPGIQRSRGRYHGNHQVNAASLSVLIPLYNEEQFIGELLRRIAAAPLPEGMAREIVLVDDCSTDASLEAVEAFAASHPEIPFRTSATTSPRKAPGSTPDRTRKAPAVCRRPESAPTGGSWSRARC